MMQALTNQHLPLSQAFEINSDDYYDDDIEDLSEEEYDDQDQYDGEEEETEDYNIVLYNLPDKKIDLKKEQLKAEQIKQRNQHIQQKKQHIKTQIHPLMYTETETHSISLKKINKLSRPQQKVQFACYIPERNILLVVLTDCITIHIYNTMNFKLTAIRKSKGQVTCMSYSPHLKMILVGGKRNLLQLWSPRTFEIEAESLYKGNLSFYDVVYVPKSNIIITNTTSNISIYNTGLRYITNFRLPIKGGAVRSDKADLQGISKHLIVAACQYEYSKRLFLINLKTKTLKEWDNIEIPPASCVKLTETNPTNVFSCLAAPEGRLPQDYNEWQRFNLTQFTIDPKTEEFAVVRNSSTTHSFSKLRHLENSKYFLAQRWDSLNKNYETFMLTIEKDKVEIRNIFSNRASSIVLNRLSIYIMIKAGSSSIVEVNHNKQIFVYGYGSIIQNAENKEKQEETNEII